MIRSQLTIRNLKSIGSVGLLVVFVGVFTGCGKEHTPELDVGEFAEYVTRFEARSASVGQAVTVTDLRIKFGNTDGSNELGVCEIGEDVTPTITIEIDTWDLLDDAEKESLLFHEMGHCVLRRRHKTEVTRVGIPASLMNPYIIDGYTYTENNSYYSRELFSHRGDF